MEYVFIYLRCKYQNNESAINRDVKKKYVMRDAVTKDCNIIHNNHGSGYKFSADITINHRGTAYATTNVSMLGRSWIIHWLWRG